MHGNADSLGTTNRTVKKGGSSSGRARFRMTGQRRERGNGVEGLRISFLSDRLFLARVEAAIVFVRA
jgi:hypothetical protein